MSARQVFKNLLKSNDGTRQTDYQYDEDRSNDAEESLYTVEKILDKRKIKGEWKYKVKWEGWSEKDCTWEPLENLNNVIYLVNDYEKKRKTGQVPTSLVGRPRKDAVKRDQSEKKEKKELSKKKSVSSTPERKKPIKYIKHKIHHPIPKIEEQERFKKLLKNDQYTKPAKFSPTAKSKHGHFEFNDRPKRIVHVKRENDYLQFVIEWYPRPNGEVPLNTQMTNIEIRRYDPELLLDFYEARLKFVQPSLREPQQETISQ